MKRYLLFFVAIGLSVINTLSQANTLPELPIPQPNSFTRDSIEAIALEELPVLPEWTDTAQLVFEYGQSLGNIAQRFSKVGDCMTASESFMHPFGNSEYELGEYETLQSVIDFFNIPARDEGFTENSFNNVGLATTSGFNTFSLTDFLFADQQWCDPNESPLTCEYRVSRSAFSLIMLGTNDVMFFDEATFDYNMRLIVLETIQKGIVPILYTVPYRPEFPEKIDTFNKIIARIAQDYDVPLVNLWVAIYDLPFYGVDEAEPIHLSLPEDGKTGYFDETGLQYGYNMRNLITLQMFEKFLQTLELLQ